jgi:hypothetical protein
MALHRDIYWVGKQWAVTGLGIQACNQKQRAQFDIEASRLWEDGVQDAVRAEKWVNADDFENAVAAARKYYPEPPAGTPPAQPAEPAKHVPEAALPKHDPAPDLPLTLAAPKFDMRLEGLRAKLTPVWRVRTGGAVRQDNQ